jgi:diguanylate cyclase (GGDEF)-like protein
VGVGAVCQAAADRLATDRTVVASVWLERGGRLRCVAGTGDWPLRDGIPPTAGVVGATFTGGAETVVADAPRTVLPPARRTDDPAGTEPATPAGTEPATPAGTEPATSIGTEAATATATETATHAGAEPAFESEVCLPIRCDGCVAGILDIKLTRAIEDGDIEGFRGVADDLGRDIVALGGPPAESGPQRMLRHMTSLSALDEPDAIGRAVLAAAVDVMGVDSAALLRSEPEEADDTGDEPAAIAAIGPLGPALAETPPHALNTIARAAEDGTACVVVGTRGDLARPELQALRAAGARSLVAVGLVANAQSHGLLLLAGRTEQPASIDDVELLELLAAHAATCLRTADLMRSLRERAATDPLTGLGHHATFHETLARAHRRPRTAVVLLDVDGFKRLNDTYGHQHGDHVLRSIAAALTGALRRGDTLFRIGGDEFAALLAVSDPAEALEAGLRLHDAVTAADLGVTVSIGVAVPRRGESDATLLDRADRALYRVKESGRDGVAIADPEPLPLLPPL